MKTLTFSQEPTFAELWDACVHLIYNDAEPLARDIENLFQKLGVSKDSEIVDVAAGSGFPALALVKDGYRVTCTDGAADEVALFNRKAKEYNLTVSCDQVLWSSLPNRSKRILSTSCSVVATRSFMLPADGMKCARWIQRNP